MKITIKKLDYHRNGISGCGFYVVLFTFRESQKVHHMAATVFPETGMVAVLDVNETAQGNIDFGQGNSWRGDNFESEIREAIRRAENIAAQAREATP